MSMDKLIYDAITSPAATDLRALVADRCYPRGALGKGDVPAAPALPYVMYGEEPSYDAQEVYETSTTTIGEYTIYVYDESGSYTRIKQIHDLIKDTMVGLIGQQDGSTRCLGCRRTALGRDTYDTVSDHNVKTATYRVAATH